MKNNWITSSEIIYEKYIFLSYISTLFIYLSDLRNHRKIISPRRKKIVSHKLTTLSIRSYCAKVFFLLSATLTQLIYWSSRVRLKDAVFRFLENIGKGYQCTDIKESCRRRICCGIAQISAADVAGFDYVASWLCHGIAT